MIVNSGEDESLICSSLIEIIGISSNLLFLKFQLLFSVNYLNTVV